MMSTHHQSQDTKLPVHCDTETETKLLNRIDRLRKNKVIFIVDGGMKASTSRCGHDIESSSASASEAAESDDDDTDSDSEYEEDDVDQDMKMRMIVGSLIVSDIWMLGLLTISHEITNFDHALDTVLRVFLSDSPPLDKRATDACVFTVRELTTNFVKQQELISTTPRKELCQVLHELSLRITTISKEVKQPDTINSALMFLAELDGLIASLGSRLTDDKGLRRELVTFVTNVIVLSVLSTTSSGDDIVHCLCRITSMHAVADDIFPVVLFCYEKLAWGFSHRKCAAQIVTALDLLIDNSVFGKTLQPVDVNFTVLGYLTRSSIERLAITADAAFFSANNRENGEEVSEDESMSSVESSESVSTTWHGHACSLLINRVFDYTLTLNGDYNADHQRHALQSEVLQSRALSLDALSGKVLTIGCGTQETAKEYFNETPLQPPPWVAVNESKEDLSLVLDNARARVASTAEKTKTLAHSNDMLDNYSVCIADMLFETCTNGGWAMRGPPALFLSSEEEDDEDEYYSPEQTFFSSESTKWCEYVDFKTVSILVRTLIRNLIRSTCAIINKRHHSVEVPLEMESHVANVITRLLGRECAQIHRRLPIQFVLCIMDAIINSVDDTGFTDSPEIQRKVTDMVIEATVVESSLAVDPSVVFAAAEISQFIPATITDTESDHQGQQEQQQQLLPPSPIPEIVVEHHVEEEDIGAADKSVAFDPIGILHRGGNMIFSFMSSLVNRKSAKDPGVPLPLTDFEAQQIPSPTTTTTTTHHEKIDVVEEPHAQTEEEKIPPVLPPPTLHYYDGLFGDVKRIATRRTKEEGEDSDMKKTKKKLRNQYRDLLFTLIEHATTVDARCSMSSRICGLVDNKKTTLEGVMVLLSLEHIILRAGYTDIENAIKTCYLQIRQLDDVTRRVHTRLVEDNALHLFRIAPILGGATLKTFAPPILRAHTTYGSAIGPLINPEDGCSILPSFYPIENLEIIKSILSTVSTPTEKFPICFKDMSSVMAVVWRATHMTGVSCHSENHNKICAKAEKLFDALGNCPQILHWELSTLVTDVCLRIHAICANDDLDMHECTDIVYYEREEDDLLHRTILPQQVEALLRAHLLHITNARKRIDLKKRECIPAKETSDMEETNLLFTGHGHFAVDCCQLVNTALSALLNIDSKYSIRDGNVFSKRYFMRDLFLELAILIDTITPLAITSISHPRICDVLKSRASGHFESLLGSITEYRRESPHTSPPPTQQQQLLPVPLTFPPKPLLNLLGGLHLPVEYTIFDKTTLNLIEAERAVFHAVHTFLLQLGTAVSKFSSGSSDLTSIIEELRTSIAGVEPAVIQQLHTLSTV